MNRLRLDGPATLTTVCALAVTLAATSCAAAASGGTAVPAAGHRSHAANAVQLGTPADSGITGCTALLDTRHVAARDLPEIRSQFARSRWPDLRATGTNYVDLIVKLRHARGTDGYEAVWFYERLAAACVRHNAEITVY